MQLLFELPYGSLSICHERRPGGGKEKPLPFLDHPSIEMNQSDPLLSKRGTEATRKKRKKLTFF